ncbi:uncharacterized protein LOC134550998 isoform X2 [Prinia subflava]|uniref:uncharacterized protein LOC134550998 isoform X2 n=1 Tax=Prinia subflava TaxID=208062 RepID=UPI002FE247E2
MHQDRKRPLGTARPAGTALRPAGGARQSRLRRSHWPRRARRRRRRSPLAACGPRCCAHWPRARGPAPRLHGVAAVPGAGPPPFCAGGSEAPARQRQRRHFLPSPGGRCAGRQRLRRRGRGGDGTGSGRRTPRVAHPARPGRARGPGPAVHSERSALHFPASCRIICCCHSSSALGEKDAVLKALLWSVYPYVLFRKPCCAVDANYRH